LNSVGDKPLFGATVADFDAVIYVFGLFGLIYLRCRCAYQVDFYSMSYRTVLQCLA